LVEFVRGLGIAQTGRHHLQPWPAPGSVNLGRGRVAIPEVSIHVCI
jgi:hypothetical protein